MKNVKMQAVLKTIRILVVILHVVNVRCQDGYSNQDILRLQQIAANEGQIDTINSYNANAIQRDHNNQGLNSVNAQYQLTDSADNNNDYHRADRGRSRKIYRIRNPFQRQLEDDGRQQESSASSQDTDTGASNQYASMQYSLPPEEFLQQMRAESYYQQQQVSTPAPSLSYTATPQPAYQYSTPSPSAFDSINQQTNQIQQLESKLSQAQSYRSLANSYQYNPSAFGLDSVQSTPAPAYLSTPLPSAQFVGTPTNTFVSSSSPIFMSSQPNPFVSSSISAIQAGTPDYNNKVTSTLGSSNYDSSDMNRKMQIEHYDNSGNGMRYPTNIGQQFVSDYPSSTVSPASTPYPDPVRDSWQNTVSTGSALSKSLQEVSLSHYPKYTYGRNQHSDQSPEPSSETHRIGNYPSANNVYLNFLQPDYQTLANLRGRARDTEQETGQPEYYSHGEYGWKMLDKKPLVHHNTYSSGSNSFSPRYQPSSLSSPSDGVAVSQMSFHMDTSKPAQNYDLISKATAQNYDQISKSSSDTEALEFAKAAAKAHENQQKRQQMYGNIYSNYDTNPFASASLQSNAYYGHEKYRNPYLYPNSQQDLITASPYYYTHSRENSDEKPKQPFDHDKALKNIVPIDVTSAVNSEATKSLGLDNNRFAHQNYNKEPEQQGLRHYKSITDAFYQDKNSIYGFNIKPKPEENYGQDQMKLIDSQYFGKQPPQEQYYGNQGLYVDSKKYADGSSTIGNYIGQPNNYQDNAPSSANVQPQGLQQPQNPPSDIPSILKLNDVPYRLTQNLPQESFRLNNNNYELNLPSPLPSRLNQNVGSHQIDVAANILNKLMANKQQGLGRPDLEHQTSAVSTINGYKVANPFNVDLKLVAEMLKGRPAYDESHMLGYRDPYSKPKPLQLDIAQLQQMLFKNDNIGSLVQYSDGPGVYSAPFLDMYGSGRFPYTGVKYSRSQEEEESISVPLADASNTHPIGAVVEQDDPMNREVSSGSDLTGNEDESVPEVSTFKDRPKPPFGPGLRETPERHRHPNALTPGHPGRHGYPRQYPKSNIGEPYPLLKPPPPHHKSRSRSSYRMNESHRRRRPRRPHTHLHRIMKTEPLFEAESDEMAAEPVVLLQPPPPGAEAKSDKVEEPSSSS